MINIKVYCLSGKAQAGKDTTAGYMREALLEKGRRVLIIHNADLLKFMCKELFGWNGEKDEAGRHILQYVGTDVIRKQEPNFWVDYITKVLTFFHADWDYVLIPDCRFPNEIERLKASGLSVTHLRVVREGYDNGLSEEQKLHPSETALDDIIPDLYICNNGNLNDLHESIVRLVSKLDSEEVHGEVRR